MTQIAPAGLWQAHLKPLTTKRYTFLVSNFDFNNNHLIHDIGSAVAVERIFSGGWDTISLCCASLHADTIHILMLVTKQLHLARMHANTALSH
ncbi:hypothetical protein F5148DRAFT_975221 [Russula earlei]|uniref:Uncharacterized protein n=1 Tax=Russula earlei TaxID=71964 RepID=A0ACC0UK23_9AGAM|nr:hypothetical protein F5148DRAFT_975221 [Russula earlei]